VLQILSVDRRNSCELDLANTAQHTEIFKDTAKRSGIYRAPPVESNVQVIQPRNVGQDFTDLANGWSNGPDMVLVLYLNRDVESSQICNPMVNPVKGAFPEMIRPQEIGTLSAGFVEYL